MEPVPQGVSCEGGKVLTPWEVSSLSWRSAWMEGEFQSFGGEHSNWCAEGKMDSNVHRRSAPPPCAPQTETLVCQCGWGLGAEAQLSEVRPRKRNGLDVQRQPEEAGLWQLRGYSEETRAHWRGKVPLFGGA